MTDLELINLIEEVIRFKMRTTPLVIDEYLCTFDDYKSHLFLISKTAINNYDSKKSNGINLRNWVFNYLKFAIIDCQRKAQFFGHRTYGKTYKISLQDHGEYKNNEVIDYSEEIENSIIPYEMSKFLKPVELMILVENLLNDRNLKDIGEDHGIGESNMCKLKIRAIKKLRKYYLEQ